MPLHPLYVTRPRTLGGIRLDAVIKESHNSRLRITANPVESGSNVNDHAIIEPQKVTIEGCVSDVSLRVGRYDFLNGTGATRSLSAWAAIKSLQRGRNPFTLQTGLQSYPNMLITDLQASQDKDTDQVLNFTATCEELLLVGTGGFSIPSIARQFGQARKLASFGVRRGELQALAASVTSGLLRTFTTSTSRINIKRAFSIAGAVF
ncbi:hypothetical protein N9K16_01620 [Alphaproteobacteria bacterium]|nr:hypothetical protein [Alphaproteobacteria bacterium]